MYPARPFKLDLTDLYDDRVTLKKNMAESQIFHHTPAVLSNRGTFSENVNWDKVKMLQLTAVGLALTLLLAAWKEASSLGEELRSSNAALRLLVEKEAQCVFTLGSLSEKSKEAKTELEVLKQGNEAMSAVAAGLKQKIGEARARVDGEREEMREAEKQNRAVQEEIRETLAKLEQINQKIAKIQMAKKSKNRKET